MPQILIFGDSIAYGAWDKEGGWVQRLKKFTNKKSIASGLEFYCAIYNLAIDGDFTEPLLKRLNIEAKQRIYGQETTFIFAIGSNDSISSKKGIFWTTPEKFKKNLEKIIKITKKYSSKIIFIGLTPADESKTSPVSWDNDVFYKNKDHEKYDEIIKSACQKNKIYFIELFEIFKKLDYKKLLEDGVHPNSDGHKLIFKIVKDYLLKNKIIY